ncbi:MAG: TonB-dependent receptor, partial [Sphingomonadales bacterium]
DLSDSIALKSTTAYRDLDSYIQVAGDGTPYAGNQAQSYATSKQFSQELELSGSMLDGNVNFVAGLYYFNENATAVRYGKSYEGTYAVTGVVSDARSQNEFYTLRAESIAAYGQAGVKVAPGLEFVLGARINRDFKRYSAKLVRAETNTVTNPLTYAEDNWTSFTPRVGVNYKVSDDVFLFASYAKGFKSGGFGTPLTGGAGIPSYDPETLTTYETGLKSSWFDNKLTFNLAGFYSDYKGVQITIITQPNSFRTTQNGGDAEIYGFDMDLEAAPFPGLLLNASLGYNHARFTNVSPGAVAASAANGLVHSAGTPLPYVPDWSASVGAQYAFDLGGLGSLTPRIDYAFKSKAVLTLADPSTFQDKYGLWNAKLSFVPEGNRNVEFSLVMNNVFDKTYYYYRNISRTTGNNLGQAADPRLFYAQLRFKY